MTKIVVFPKEDLLVAAKIGMDRGYNRSMKSEAELKKFSTELEEMEAVNLAVSFSMVHEHIACVKVEPYIRAVIQTDGKGSNITLDVDMELFNGLPVYNTDTGDFEVAGRVIPGVRNSTNEKVAEARAITANPTGCAYWNKPEEIPSNGLIEVSELIERFDDTSHLMHALIKCRECGQLYYYEYYDEIDFEDGDDPVYMTYIPVDTDEEIERLKAMSRSELMSVVPRLHFDIPKGADAPLVRWVA
jgi:hypothetical protein